MLCVLTTAFNIYNYDTPIFTIKDGKGQILNGDFNLIHVINLTNYEEVLAKIIPTIQINTKSHLGSQLIHQTEQINKLIIELKGNAPRNRRSINWIGTAWKWIAGSPDATDWDEILKSQNKLIKNNNKQYKVNNALMATANKILNEYNKIIGRLDENSAKEFQQATFNRLGIIKEEIKEIVRAIQLAKGGIINTNLLDKEEIGRLLAEIETLPYGNEIEAIEYAEPIILVKNSIILYTISIPKTSGQNYNHVHIRSTIKNNRQIYLEYNQLLVNQNELFGIKNECKSINNITLCKSNQVSQIDEKHCISQIIRGTNASCDYKFSNNEIIEPINENTIFLGNFKGEIGSQNSSTHADGNLLIEYYNETIEIKGINFTNRVLQSSQILPPILQANITEGKIKIDVDYLHNLHLNNIEKLHKLIRNHKVTVTTGALIVIIIIIFISTAFIWKYRKNKNPETETKQEAAPIFLNIPSAGRGFFKGEELNNHTT